MITKQCLHRPLRQMIDQGHIKQTTDVADRRVRRLQLTAKGKKLEHELREVQCKRFAEIFERVGPNAEKHWRKVMPMLSEKIEF